MFCPKCGSLVIPKKERNKVAIKCSCGFKEIKEEGSMKISEKTKNEEKEIAVIENENEEMPICDDTCPKCGHDKAYYFIKQTRAADESPTKFMRCVKCRFTWREYD